MIDKYLQEIQKEEFKTIVIELRDPDNSLYELIEHIKKTANIGHSFPVVVDPGYKEYEEKFFMDGDGPFYIKNILIK